MTATETPRPVIPFSEALAQDICARMEAGESLRAICAPRDAAGCDRASLGGDPARLSRAAAPGLGDRPGGDAGDAEGRFDVIRWRASRVAPKAYRDDEAEDEPRGFEIYVQDFSTGEILSGPRHVGPGG
ncbi:MAG: hypothetical protein ABS77_13470 [Phenylobacterium sp. SCN 69-14]|nr:MAG: hypothetical protein ABS77_13470 [Phenylobacterium sp. SCN 69-14]